MREKINNQYKRLEIMKKFGFLVSAVCMVLASLTSCFSSGGEINQSKIVYDGYRATKLILDGITKINAICEVGGLLKGYAEVDQETSVDLYKQNVDGLLVFLKEIQDKNISRLKDPESVIDESYIFPVSASVVQAFCYPHEVKFVHPVKLTVETQEANGMDLLFSYQGKEQDFREVKTDDHGVYTDIPHFSYWVFKMNFSIDYLETTEKVSEVFSDECLVASSTPRIAKYTASYGFDTETKNPFVYAFLKQWIGDTKTQDCTYQWTCKVPGTEYYRYRQNVYSMRLTSGSHQFYFNVYGKPRPFQEKFVHNGGGGSNP